MKKLRILELTNYSAGGCGVWGRAKQEAIELSKRGYEVRVFSSNIDKGTEEETSKLEDSIGNVKIKRFPAKKLGGESFMRWEFKDAALEFKPDIIIAHSYRHLHTNDALKIAKQLNAKVFLVTHAPFGRHSTRSFISNIIVWLYDKFVGPKYLNKFTKILAITKWELPYLRKLRIKESKIVYSPNGIPKEFFQQKKSKETNKILFLGRIAPIKDLATLIASLPYVKDQEIVLELVGPPEKDYQQKLELLVDKLGLKNRVLFSGPIYNLKKKIEKIDSAKIFVLPSKSEGMPQALIEAMSRGKIVISSDTPAGKDIVIPGKNGYLFRVGDSKDLADKINLALSLNSSSMNKQAIKTTKKFVWTKIIKDLENLF